MRMMKMMRPGICGRVEAADRFLQSVSQSVITTLLPTEHMVPTHSDLLHERAMESQHLVVTSGRARTRQVGSPSPGSRVFPSYCRLISYFRLVAPSYSRLVPASG